MFTSRWSRLTAMLVFAGGLFCSAAVHAGDFWKLLVPVTEPAKALHREKPETCKDPPVEQLANQIDWLEHHIDEYGTIVPKQPDVWGQSRLTRHREEYERQMATQLGAFEVRYQAALSRSDQAFLGYAMTLQAAASDSSTGPKSNDVSANITNLSGLLPVTGVTSSTDSTTGAVTRAATKPTDIPLTRTAPATPTSMPHFGPSDVLALEPTVVLNEMSRYLGHLQELRRINEGDDIGDAPGYALDLVRIPISVLPGKKTREGYGAEITVTASPVLTPELLPATFRSLVQNDVVDLLAPVLTQWVNDPDIRDSAQLMLQVERGEYDQMYLNSPCQCPPTSPRQTPQAATQPLAAATQPSAGAATNGARGGSPQANMQRFGSSIRRGYPQATAHASGSKTRRAYMPIPPSEILDVLGEHVLARLIYDTYWRLSGNPVNREMIQYGDVRAFLSEEVHAAYHFLGPDLSTGEPPETTVGGTSHDVWHAPFAGRALVQAIRDRRMNQVFLYRGQYMAVFNVDPNLKPSGMSSENDLRQLYAQGGSLPQLDPNMLLQWHPFEAPYPVCKTITAGLGWALLVESALLNDQLNEDFREAAASPTCRANCPPGQYYEFYGPNPPIEARQAFMEYVRCRWPIRVFALDPVVDQQNVEDSFSRRRELQIALAMGFVSGQVNAGNMMRFARRLEWDMATIGLNETAVGFSHGDDTFGWRFYPRFQTPPNQGTLAALWQTVAGGPTSDDDMCHRQLEPQMRECVAIVVMPSFIPYVTFDTRSRFFRLTDPKCTEVSMRDTLLLSRSIKAMKSSAAACSQCAACYRDGEVDRLLRRVDQLDRTVPLQTMNVQLPFENTAGGFELFNRGVTDLAPELTGWYGAPGIDLRGGTTLFLIGKSFGVNGTHVIAGGREANYTLLSRQVMQVQFPTGPAIVSDNEGRAFVDVHVATSYGVTDHLLIPVAASSATSAIGNPQVAFDNGQGFNQVVKSTLDNTKNTYSYTPQPVLLNPPYLTMSMPAIATLPTPQSVTFIVALPTGEPIGTVSAKFALNAFDGRYYLSGPDLNTFVTSVGTTVTSYFNNAYSTKRPAPMTLVLKGQLDGTPATPINGQLGVAISYLDGQ